MRRLPALTPLAVALSCTANGAQTVECDTATSTFEMQACADRDFQKADAALNAAYKRALDKIQQRGDQPAPYDSKAYDAALRAAQRAWIAYRDADCNGVVPFEWGGGTGTGAAVLGCLTDKTNARTKDLTDGFGPQ
jgi:uncharacterized protein YecT (DUF1311 family)